MGSSPDLIRGLRGNDNECGCTAPVRAAPARRAGSMFIFTAYFTVCRAASERRAGEWKFRGYCYDCCAPLARVFVALAALNRSAFPSKLRFRTSNNEPGCPGIGVRAFAARRRRVADKEHKVNMQEAAAKFFTTETQRTRRRRNALAQRTQRRREGREGFSEGRCSAPSMSSWLIGFCGSAAISSAAGYAPSRSASSAKPSTTISQAGLGLGSGGPAAPHSSGRRTKAVR